MPDPMTIQDESDHFSPYRADGKLYGFVCVVTGANMPVGSAIVTELAGRANMDMLEHCESLIIEQHTAQRASTPARQQINPLGCRAPSSNSTQTRRSSTIPTQSPRNKVL